MILANGFDDKKTSFSTEGFLFAAQPPLHLHHVHAEKVAGAAFFKR